MAFFCVICEKWYNNDKNFKEYTVIFCPKCQKNGKNIKKSMNKKLFH